MARKGKARKVKRTVLEVKDYQAANEKLHYMLAVGGVVVAFLIIAVLFGIQVFGPQTTPFRQQVHNLWQIPVLLAIYPVACIMILNAISARPRRKQLKQLGPQAKVMPTNHEKLHKLIQDASKLLSMKKAPDAYVIDDPAPTLYSVPGGAGSIIISKKLFQILRPEEVAAALAKEMGHIKSGHVSVDLAITAIRGANPLIKIAALPVFLLSVAMRDWLDTIEYTADRCAVLVTRRLATVTASMVKLAAARATMTQLKDRKKRGGAALEATSGEGGDEADAMMTDITPEELDAYLSGSSEEDDMMSGEIAQVERQFKISRFIDEQRNLRDRIRVLNEWVDTDQCAGAIAKVDEIRQQLKR